MTVTHHRFAAGILAACLAAAWSAQAQDAAVPEVEITETAAYDASDVAPFRGEYPDVYAYIDAHRDEHLAHLQRWVRQRSISAQDDGVREMATLLRDDLADMGFAEAELVETKGHPGVWGYYDAGAEHTLLVYMMYDVQPIEPVGWDVDAFAGEVIDHEHGRVLMARGATNQKGPQRAFLNALQAIIATKGKPPVNIMVAAEGEEELGSLNYNEIVDRYEARMREADGVYFPMNTQSPDGDVGMFLGVKGIAYFELEARGNEATGGPAKHEVHGSLNALLDAPAWRLVNALSSMVSDDGNRILIDGYYDDIRAPNAEEQRLYNGLVATREENADRMLAALGASRWKDGLTAREALANELFGTTLNIDGLVSGYTGEGMKTILPHRAVAKVDSRLVPNQTPEKAETLIRTHLDRHGFSDIELRRLSGYPPAQTSVETPLVQAAIAAYRKHGFTPTVAPRLAGSAPYYVFTERLGLPMIAGGLGHGAGAHAPNEYMVIEPKQGSKVAGLAEVERFYVDLLYALSDSLDGSD